MYYFYWERLTKRLRVQLHGRKDPPKEGMWNVWVLEHVSMPYMFCVSFIHGRRQAVMPHKVCPYDATPQCPMLMQTELWIISTNFLLLSFISMSSTKASHYSLSHCNVKCGHPEKAEMGEKGRIWGSLPFTWSNKHGSQDSCKQSREEKWGLRYSTVTNYWT